MERRATALHFVQKLNQMARDKHRRSNDTGSLRATSVLWLAMFSLLLSADGPDEDTVRGDRQKILGTWRVVSKDQKRLTIPITTTRLGSKINYTLDSSNDLKQIDMQHRRPRGRPRSAAKGIYTLEGDTLKICWVYQGKRPTSFKAPQPGRGRLLVLKRVK